MSHSARLQVQSAPAWLFAHRIAFFLMAALLAASSPRLDAQPLVFTHFAGTLGGSDAVDGAAR